MSENKTPVSQEIKKHLLTGISWMIPLIVAAGICIALGQVLGGTNVGEKTGTIPWMLNQIGGWGMGLIVPLICAAIAYSIADRPGFAPGLIVGFVCGQIHTGFIGGIPHIFCPGDGSGNGFFNKHMRTCFEGFDRKFFMGIRVSRYAHGVWFGLFQGRFKIRKQRITPSKFFI